MLLYTGYPPEPSLADQLQTAAANLGSRRKTDDSSCQKRNGGKEGHGERRVSASRGNEKYYIYSTTRRGFFPPFNCGEPFILESSMRQWEG